MTLAPLLLAAALSQAGAAEPSTPTATAAATPTLELTGFIQATWSNVDAPAGGRDANSFDLRHARLEATGRLVPRLGYRLEVDAAGQSIDRIVQDAYVAYRAAPGLELRLGQFTTPFGAEQREPETRLLWVNTSYVVAGLARGPDRRDLGLGAFGSWSLGDRLGGALGVEAAAAVVNGAGPNTTDELVEKNVWARAGVTYTMGEWTARGGLSYGYGRQLESLGADGQLGTIDDVTFYFQRVGGDLTLDTPWFVAVAEIALGRTDTSGVAGVAQARGQVLGVYGKTPWNLGPIVRLDGYDPSDRVAGNGRERITLGAYYDLVPLTARLVFNYELDRSGASVKTGDAATLLAQVVF